MSVVGIDLGNLASYIAVARNRGIDVIANEVSNRDTPSLVSFGIKQRQLGESAKTQEISNLKNTVGSLKRIIGRRLDDPEIQELEKRFISADLVDVDGEVGVKVSYQGEPRTFSATQLMAMYLGKLRDTAATELKLPISDVVVSVPGWFNDKQRRAMLDACKIANLNCLRLMNETTAAALGYGITKTDLPETDPRNVIIVDIGHSSYNVAAVSYLKGQLTIKATAFDNKVGGRYMNELLVNHFAKECQKKYNIDILSSAKATFRLRAGCEKLKKVLSANSQAPLNIESIMNDKDISVLMKREEFEELIGDQLERLAKPLGDVLSEVGWTSDQIFSVEIVGGSSRIPALKEKISSLLGKELSFTLNQDEAVARGCALQCAILSPIFKVRNFMVTDIQNFPVKFTWAPTSETSSGSEVDLLAGTNPFIGSFAVKNVTSIPEGELSTVKVKARLDLHGIVTVESAHIAEEIVTEEEVPNPDKPEETMKKTKKMIKKHDLPVVSMTSSLDSVILDKCKEAENEMFASDKLVIDTEHAKNALEEYVYETRSKLGGAYADFIDAAIKDDYIKALNDTENWLYEEGEDATKSVYIAKLEELNQVGGPVILRYREASERPYAIEQLSKALSEALTLVSSVDDKYDHISEEDRQKVSNKQTEIQKWLDAELAALEALPKHETPSLRVAQLKAKQNEISAFASSIFSKPKPKPAVNEAPEESKPVHKDEPEADQKLSESQMDID
ncbi:adenyl-nucleotide exchange factor sse1 [Massospora cicadina]|nr:adenyl-nucleotide exchange factor sse1 [Massospora cicadina]